MADLDLWKKLAAKERKREHYKRTAIARKKSEVD